MRPSANAGPLAADQRPRPGPVKSSKSCRPRLPTRVGLLLSGQWDYPATERLCGIEIVDPYAGTLGRAPPR